MTRIESPGNKLEDSKHLGGTVLWWRSQAILSLPEMLKASEETIETPRVWEI